MRRREEGGKEVKVEDIYFVILSIFIFHFVFSFCIETHGRPRDVGAG